MIDTPSQLTCLSSVMVGERARIACIDGDRNLARRLLSLGLREGVEVEVIQRRGRSVVVSIAGTRVAIGSTIAEKLLMRVLKESSQKNVQNREK